ncbi:MAG: hypothetical protein ACJ79H_11750 [Myxococcales bacterium]
MADVDITDDALRAALAPSGSCLTIEQLGRLCDRDHAGSADARAAEHVAGCLRCRTELALLKQFEGGALRPEEQEDARWIVGRLTRDVGRLTAGEALPARRRAPVRAAGWRRFVAPRALLGGLAAAAAALLVVLNVPGREASAPALPPDATAGPSSFRSDAIAVKAPAGDVDAAPKELRWESAAGAASYSVQVMEVDRTPVWSGQSRDPRISLPASVRARVVPGKPFLWQVVAKDANGQPIATSDFQRFRLRMRAHSSQ